MTLTLRRGLYCFVVLAMAVVPSALASNVLLLWDDVQGTLPENLNPNTRNLIAALRAQGMEVTLSTRPQQGYNGFNPAPQNYDAVIHLNGYEDVFKVMPIAGAAALVDYVENGGGLITSENTSAQLAVPETFGGLSQIMADAMPYQRTGGRGVGPITVTPVAAGHPLLQGLPASFTFTAGRLTGKVRTYASDPAAAIMQDELGSPAVVVRELGEGRLVALHSSGNYSNGTSLSDPNVQRLYINAVKWADRKPPLALELTRAVGSTFIGTAEAPFTLRFLESVTGLDGNDFEVVTTGTLTYGGVQVSAVNFREYTVNVIGLSGQGLLTLNLRDNDSITDRSFNANPLGGEGVDNGRLNGPSYSVDRQAPRITGFVASPLIVPIGTSPTMTFIFNEIMNTSVHPTVTIATLSNGTISASSAGSGDIDGDRVSNGLLALYPFNEGSGALVRDISGAGTPLNLTIQDTGAISWQDDVLSVTGSTIISSDGPATKIINAVRASNAVTMEAWIRPANLSQAGPARILSISEGTSSRNLTLGQDLSRYEGRLRTTATSENGIPALDTDFDEGQTELQHLVYTRDSSGNATLYLDGEVEASGEVGGDLSNWSTTQPLLLANEFTGNRPWQGQLHLVALYSRALSAAEVGINLAAGPTLPEPPGNGRWLDNRTWQVSFDRPVLEADSGSATVAIAGARDLVGNTMATDRTHNIGLVGSTLRIVSQPPVFDYVEIGSRLELNVEIAGGIGTIGYEWYRETPSKALEPIGTNAPVLVIPSVDRDDSGSYYCVISDEQRVVQTEPAVIQVVEALPVSCRWCSALIAVLIVAIGSRTLRKPAHR